ncbi:MAG TPA: hypothetical protein VFV53_04670, partial [Candidatus Limnocylindrales bacterium]|nr:hypothetical protein [Candidatus Limnocylindrales bacterium]
MAVIHDDATEEAAGADRMAGDPRAAVSEAHGSGFGRRRFLRVLGLGALSVVPLPVVSELIRGERGDTETGPVRGQGAAARTRDGRIRQWTMIIDLRACDGCQSTGQPPRCTAACIEGHFAPEPMEWIQV